MAIPNLVTPQVSIKDEDLKIILAHLKQLRGDSEFLGFTVTTDLLKWAIDDYESKPHTYGQARSSIEHISAVYQQELSREFFVYIEPEKAKFMRSFDTAVEDPAYGVEALNAFPQSVRDMHLAGNCYGCGYNDACVFHLVRVLEYGLAAMATVFSEPFTHENWHNIIERLESKIRKIDSSTFGADWRDKQKFYSEAACEFMFFKDAWRNHVMHGRDSYDDGRAQNIYSHACAFMRHLARGGLRA